MAKIWAKSDGIGLREHSEELLRQSEKLFSVVGHKFTRNGEDYIKVLLDLSIFFHDVGKVSPLFQIKVGNWKYEPKKPFPDIPHSIFSLLWIDEKKVEEYLKNKISSQDVEKYKRIIFSAVAFHHWRNGFDSIVLGNNKNFIRGVKYILEDKEFRKRLFENLKNEFNQLNYFSDFLDFNKDFANIIINCMDLFAYITPPYSNVFFPYRLELDESLKVIWVIISGLLIRIDHFASFVQKENIEESLEKEPPNRGAIEQVLDQKFKSSFWQKDVLKGHLDKNIILIAPTGLGKTEFAFLWGAGEKLFFTLPLRSAVNSIYERAKGIFGNDNVGLLHSDADLYLYENSVDYEGESFRALDMAHHLAYPVLVSTGDQIFPAALKYPGYEKIYATLSYSRLVIDEVQAYDPRAIAIIVKLIKDVEKLGGKFLLMTATLPSFVKKELEERIGNEAFIMIDKYSDYENVVKHRVKIVEGDIENMIDSIIGKAKEGKRVLVIVNTVDKAQNLYDLLGNNQQEYKKFLIHSRFTLEDRKRLEKDITEEFKNPKPENEREGKILVATQVVEASLDIDADILFTELAPIDALVQRMGRVMRRIKKESLNQEELKEPNVIVLANIKDNKLSSMVYSADLLALSLALLVNIDINDVLNTEQGSKKSKNKFAKNLTEKTKQKLPYEYELSEGGKKRLVEELYTKLEKISQDFEVEYMERFYETLKVLGAGYQSDCKEEALEIFREIYDVPIIPKNRTEDLKKELYEFVKKRPISYTSFKMEVLSKFVVNIDYRYLIKKNESLIDASYIASYLEEIDIKSRKKIIDWLRDIYIIEYIKYNDNYVYYVYYDKNLGLKLKDVKGLKE